MTAGIYFSVEVCVNNYFGKIQNVFYEVPKRHFQENQTIIRLLFAFTNWVIFSYILTRILFISVSCLEVFGYGFYKIIKNFREPESLYFDLIICFFKSNYHNTHFSVVKLNWDVLELSFKFKNGYFMQINSFDTVFFRDFHQIETFLFMWTCCVP